MFQPNSVIAGRYQVVRLVGQGGMSNLYLAYDRKYNNASVVVKEMTASYSDPKEQQMAVDLFHREAKLLASLNHRHIPKVFDYFQFAGKYYLSMEYIDGVDLAVKLEETKGPLPETQVLEWGEQIAKVLFYLHKHEPPIVFRDVKPSNIMISSLGVKLIDFGIARHFDQAKKGDTMRIGSPGYAPPEQYAAQTDPRSDIYALGVTLHHALTGRDPTATNTPFLVPPARDLNPNLAEATAAMLSRATQLDPADRYQSALDMKKDMTHILKRGKQSTRVVGAPPAAPQAGPVSPKSDDKAASKPSDPPKPAKGQADAKGTPKQSSGNQNQGSSNAQGQAAQGGTPKSATGSVGVSPTSGSMNPDATPVQPVAKPKKKKKRFSFGRLLLTACLFAIVAGGTALAVMDADIRNHYVSQAKMKIEALLGDISKGENPEDRLRQSLLAGDPTALLPLFQSSEFQEMSKEKQELFRLNLLAAGSADGNLTVVHLLLPEGQEDPKTWQVSSAALSAINGGGGLGSNLFVIVPKTYPSNGLATTLEDLSKEKEKGAAESFLIIGGEDEPWPDTAPADALFLSSKELPGRLTVQQLATDSYEELFAIDLDTNSPPTVWAIPGAVPTTAIESQTAVSKLPDKNAIAEMVEQANNLSGRLALLARDAQQLDEIDAQGEVLLLAISADELVPLGPNQTGTARVLSSPFEDVAPRSVRLQLQPRANLTPDQARLFDALILSATPKNRTFHGLTIRRTPQGESLEKTPTVYRWDQGAWLPSTDEKGQDT
jgi:serine/threonine protein kinase